MNNVSSAWKRAKQIHFKEQVLKNFQNIEHQKYALSGLRPEKNIYLQSLEGWAESKGLSEKSPSCWRKLKFTWKGLELALTKEGRFQICLGLTWRKTQA